MATMVVTMQEPEFFSPRELARILGVSRKKVYRLMGDGVIEFIQLDRQKRIPRTEKERICRLGFIRE